jgi:hypothetical protein
MKEPEQLELRLYADEVNVDGIVDQKRPIKYIGKARKQNNGLWTCLADVAGALCLVEVKITEQGTVQA